jgi:TetR/AcrR family transcriptional regulator, regulator of cefoperazone and chloramphenicol sensitivity
LDNGHDSSDRGVYDSPIRREQAQLTRARIASAARELFLQHGFARTRLRQIADLAGVSEQTIYAVYKNKRGVLFAIMDDMDLGAGVEQAFRDLADADGDALRQLSIFVAYDRRLFEREREHLLILRDAGSSEPELTNTYQEGRERGRQAHLRIFLEWEAAGLLHPLLDPERAADLYHAVSSLEAYDYLVFERGWSPEEWQEHTFRALDPVLIHPDARS